MPRPAESLLDWFFFFFVWLSSVGLWFSYLIHYLPSFVTGCNQLCKHMWEHYKSVLLCFCFTKCTWALNIRDFLQRELSVPRPCCCRCPLDALQGYVSSEFIRLSEWCQKKWKVIFLNAPHRVQSHYRVRQIQLVTEFAAQERGQVKQAGEGCGPGMTWILNRLLCW